ncbi:HprK-related kinase B [Tropicimonas marinistellae]|uniref:HprK-related kinase B n=1 Tax=Tropicimonas marinistellae TaxID=1739787 RepID=UPI00082D40B2|nr:HprK-related kinase B [Tropicimonas marinistellae]
MNTPHRTVADVLAALDLAPLNAVAPLHLGVGPVRLAIRASDPLRAELEAYFHEALAAPAPTAITIDVLEGQQLAPAPAWVDWAREPGKTGRKDAYCNLANGRLVHKLRTGVTFLQSPDAVAAFGPCAAHPNQIVNFVNTQILNACLRDGWQICHAAAVTDGARTLAIAGFSGGGKSTAILRMMELAGTAFVANDRLLVRPAAPAPEALGIPKQPRINPGTIVTNARLRPMLAPERIAELEAMPPETLWNLEEKHDLIVRDIYGPDRVRVSAPLTDFWVLNWQRGSADPTEIRPVTLSERPDLLGAIMKSPGPFYQKPGGTFLRDDEPLDAPAYLAALDGVRVSEVTGGVDFDALQSAGARLLAARTAA